MDYTSLKEITETIIRLIQAEVDPTNNVKVLPELLRNDDNGVGFYLYHVQENNRYKNYPASGNDTPPVNFTPMALNLFYQLSPNWKVAKNDDAYEEQKLMSVAMKAIHDHSIIRKTIPKLPDFPDGKDIDIKITLQTLTSSESVQYWAAAESPVRLSAYYEVSVVFLEPEKQLSYAGRVLTYGNFIFTRGAPQITSSENTIEYMLPGGLTARQVKIQPAQAPINSIVSFLGTGFSGGTPKLLLTSQLWPGPALADGLWSLDLISENQLNITVQSSATLIKDGTPVDIIPGLYAAQISITEQKTLPNGTVKTFNHVSNQFPFSVMPWIDSILPVSGVIGTTFTVTVPFFDLTNLDSKDIQVYIGETKLSLRDAGVLSPGKFKITSTTTIDLKVPDGLSAGPVALRILIGGIESPPNWITIT